MKEMIQRERELVTSNEIKIQRLRQQLTRAEETIRRDKQQMQQMIQRERELVNAKDKEIAQLQEQLSQNLMRENVNIHSTHLHQPVGVPDFCSADLRLPCDTTSEQLAIRREGVATYCLGTAPLAPNKADRFSLLDLKDNLSSELAIPLVLPSSYEWNKETGLIIKNQENTSPEALELRPVEEALDLLKTINKPVAVLAICGPYHTGKSFFISRVVGKPGTFKLGHSMEACTRGIWLSTTALECEEFVLLVLDTEGIGAVEGEGPESFTTKLLVATILLSSFLIYNSTEVPKQADLQQMSSFTHLSTAINVREKKENDPKEFQKYFPKFMWLLRDVTNPPYDEDEEDENAALSKYLREVVLTPTGQKDCDSVITAITTLFPQPLLCDWLPYPNEEPQNSDLDNEDNIDEDFTEQSDKIINGERGIKASQGPKVGFDQQLPVTGADLAELAKLYIKAINQKGSVPSLEGSWKAVIKLKLTKEAEALVGKYEEEMSSQLSGDEPLEEEILERDSGQRKPTLMGLHDSIFATKRRVLLDKAVQMLPRSSESPTSSPTPPEESEEIRDVMEGFELSIVRREGCVVKSGVLHKFITQNLKKSEVFCDELWERLEKEAEVQNNYTRALNKYDPQICAQVLQDLGNLKVNFTMSAIGPAREAVFKSRSKKWKEREGALCCIPGPPTHVAVVGKSEDAIKLQWEKPAINAEAATMYIVEFRKAGKNAWEKSTETSEQWHIMRKLKSNTTYEFRVSSWNEEAERVKRNIEEMLRKARHEVVKGSTQHGGLGRAIFSAIGFLGVPIGDGTAAYDVGDMEECYVPRNPDAANHNS